METVPVTAMGSRMTDASSEGVRTVHFNKVDCMVHDSCLIKAV